MNAGDAIDTQVGDIDLAAEYIVKALALSETKIFAPGVSEFAWGTEKLKQLAASTAMEIVCANVTGFTPYTVLEKNNGRTKMLVTSVLDPALSTSGKTPQLITDPITALRHINEQVTHDLFVVIVHGGSEMRSMIIEQCPDIDLVIDGTSTEFEYNPPTGGQPPVVANNSQGMYVAYIDYVFRENGTADFSDPGQIRVAVDKVKADPAVSALIREYNARREAFLKRPADSGRTSTIELEAHVHYVGSESCRLCHPANNDCWAKTRHAGAMESLSARSRQNDPSCLYCHMTGMDKNSPPDMLMGTAAPAMAGVQCEACHGPGREHASDPQNAHMLSIDENTCTRCHTKFRDPGFDFHHDLDKLNCGICPEQTGCKAN